MPLDRSFTEPGMTFVTGLIFHSPTPWPPISRRPQVLSANDRETNFPWNERIPDKHHLTLCDGSIRRAATSTPSPTNLESLKVQLARLPTRKELARAALGVIFCSAALVILWFEVWPPIR